MAKEVALQKIEELKQELKTCPYLDSFDTFQIWEEIKELEEIVKNN